MEVSFKKKKRENLCVCGGVFLCCPFSPRDVLDEILNLIESVSEGLPAYFCSEAIVFLKEDSISEGLLCPWKLADSHIVVFLYKKWGEKNMALYPFT